MQNLLSRRRLYASWLSQRPTHEPPNEASFRRLWVSLDPKSEVTPHSSSTTTTTGTSQRQSHTKGEAGAAAAAAPRTTSRSLPAPSTRTKLTTNASVSSSHTAAHSRSQSRSTSSSASASASASSVSTLSASRGLTLNVSATVSRGIRRALTDVYYNLPLSPSSRLGALLPNRAGTMLSPLPETTMSAPTTPHAHSREQHGVMFRATSDGSPPVAPIPEMNGVVNGAPQASQATGSVSVSSSAAVSASGNPRQQTRSRVSRSSSQEQDFVGSTSTATATATSSSSISSSKPAASSAAGRGRWSRRAGSSAHVGDAPAPSKSAPGTPKNRKRAQSVGRDPRSSKTHGKTRRKSARVQSAAPLRDRSPMMSLSRSPPKSRRAISTMSGGMAAKAANDLSSVPFYAHSASAPSSSSSPPPGSLQLSRDPALASPSAPHTSRDLKSGHSKKKSRKTKSTSSEKKSRSSRKSKSSKMKSKSSSDRALLSTAAIGEGEQSSSSKSKRCPRTRSRSPAAASSPRGRASPSLEASDSDSSSSRAPGLPPHPAAAAFSSYQRKSVSHATPPHPHMASNGVASSGVGKSAAASASASAASRRKSRSSQTVKKTVFLVRHAESANNVDKRQASKGLARLKAGHFPSPKQLSHAAQCLKLDMNSPLSEKGTLQIKAVNQSVEQTNFLKENKVDVIITSLLERARLTCDGLFGTKAADLEIPILENELLVEQKASEYLSHIVDVIITSPLERARLTCDGLFGTKAADLEIPILENELLVEQKASEYLVSSWLKERSQGFIYWLSNRPEKTIVVVSHSAYLRAMLNTKNYFSNCTVWQTTLNIRDYKGQRYYKWLPVVMLYQPPHSLRQELSEKNREAHLSKAELEARGAPTDRKNLLTLAEEAVADDDDHAAKRASLALAAAS